MEVGYQGHFWSETAVYFVVGSRNDSIFNQVHVAPPYLFSKNKFTGLCGSLLRLICVIQQSRLDLVQC